MPAEFSTGDCADVSNISQWIDQCLQSSALSAMSQSVSQSMLAEFSTGVCAGVSSAGPTVRGVETAPRNRAAKCDLCLTATSPAGHP